MGFLPVKGATAWRSVKKVICYTRLYGAARTFAKVNGYCHTHNIMLGSKISRQHTHHNGHIGIIGCGSFSFSTLGFFLQKHYQGAIRGVMDPNVTKALSLTRRYGALYHTQDVNELISDPRIDLVFIAANHASHANYAIRALHAGKHVHLEKPHALSINELVDLCSALSRSRGRLRLGFNRRDSALTPVLKAHFDAQAGPATINWFIVGHRLAPDHWYLMQGEGGRILGNLCHWTDALLQLISEPNRYPIVIIPVHADRLQRTCVVSYRFGDGSLASLTFTSRGRTFEGVRERLCGQRGNLLYFMEDYQKAQFCIDDKTIRWKSRFRDLGHEASVKRSYALTGRDESVDNGWSLRDVWETGELMLKTKQALDSGRIITLRRTSDAALRALKWEPST